MKKYKSIWRSTYWSPISHVQFPEYLTLKLITSNFNGKFKQNVQALEKSRVSKISRKVDTRVTKALQLWYKGYDKGIKVSECHKHWHDYVINSQTIGESETDNVTSATVQPAFKGHHCTIENVSLHDRCPFVTGSLTGARRDIILRKFSLIMHRVSSHRNVPGRQVVLYLPYVAAH